MIMKNMNSKKVSMKLKPVDSETTEASFRIKTVIKNEEVGKLGFILSTDTLTLGSVEDDAYNEGGVLADFRQTRTRLKVSDYRGDLKFLLEDVKAQRSDFICLNPDDVRELVKEMRVWLSDKGGEIE